MRHAVFLVPGFFGFARLGGIRYFRHVRQQLEAAFALVGHEVEVFAVHTLPTASIRRRARLLVDAMVEAKVERFERVHVIGHSTGGLDARLLVTPGVALGRDVDHFEDAVHSVVTISAPHHGTPIAAFFTQVAGKHLLWALTLVLIVSLGGVGGRSLAWAGRLLGWLTQLDDLLGLDDTVADYFAEKLLADFTPERREEVRSFLEEVERDRGSLLQLTPEAMDIFNAAVADHPRVRYWSYLTAAPRPGPRVVRAHLFRPKFYASYPVFSAMHALARGGSELYPLPELPEALAPAAVRAFGGIPDGRDNDGVVPVLSQPWGEVAGLVRADHLDVCGHFAGGASGRKHTDWLSSGADFGWDDFVALYRDVAGRLLGTPLPAPPSSRVIALPWKTT
ncbi:MAG: triacylglycerol lipase [Deltaproteobacteria bacterium]|nr:triacylglycerol lipase [Deltaproteobacteria bacterium]